jgi:hypothetical protein
MSAVACLWCWLLPAAAVMYCFQEQLSQKKTKGSSQAKQQQDGEQTAEDVMAE